MGMVCCVIFNLIVFDICGVQPMNSLIGQVFVLCVVYGKDLVVVGVKEVFYLMYGLDVMFFGQGVVKKFLVLVVSI